jgi:hypothetical protein
VRQVLVSVQDQSMKDEGLAREAINLVQKLRKEAHVTPSDAFSVYFEVSLFLSINSLNLSINVWLF